MPVIKPAVWQLALAAYLLIINIIAFAAMGADKSKARRKLRRISEKHLFLPVVLGGGLGGILGMYFFRHKTKHWYFVVGFPAILILEAGAVCGIIWLLRSGLV